MERSDAVVSTSIMDFSFSTYYLACGNLFILSDKVPGQEVSRKYVPAISYSGSFTQFGFIP
jgi:hypothetical protein